ncbi:predicted protein [Scheffersomyces stipitis CBS 6054]|uniref:Ubiquitin thioesterase OTU n=1 Tax=Scheffersomyces stipitis (strain ATCC 58785 / CBS 6054 / NBRC 10063 / NRRL Y-11545) TaxID=322104 RepID=A3LR91_PICST|nr:predicted protein [Scheffersomyces stipitis CBS 6054]ABN65701.2 predicted protein [Scheffersomyces stipitis CBS 6054]
MRLRLKSNKAVKTVAPDSAETLGQFLDTINSMSELKEIESHILTGIKTGFPPKSVDLTSTSKLLAESEIRDGDQLLVEFGEMVAKTENDENPKESASETVSETEIPSVYIPQQDKYLILRNIPDDNSCMFNSISYALSGYSSYETFSPPSELRSVIVSYIQNSPELYNEAILGRSPEDYCKCIIKKDSWGGAIELGILADWFGIRINCLDIESGNFITFEKEQGPQPDKFIILIYSGVHYDVVAVNSTLSVSDGDKANDITSWSCGGKEESAVLEASHKLCKLLQSRNYSTNTTTFRVRCLNCYEILVGETGASKHAEETGHYNFGEVK